MFVFRHKNQLQFRPDLITSPCASSILPPLPSAPQNVCGEMKQTPLRLLQLFYYYYYYFHMNLFWVFLLFIFFIQVSLISMSPIPCVLWKKSNWVTRDGFFFWRLERKELMSDCNSRVKPCMLVMCGIVFGLLFPFLFFLSFACVCELVYDDCIAPWLHLFSPRHLLGFICKKKEKKEKESVNKCIHPSLSSHKTSTLHHFIYKLLLKPCEEEKKGHCGMKKQKTLCSVLICIDRQQRHRGEHHRYI